MLYEESVWIGRVVKKLPSESFPILNLGSSTGEFRKITQPFIHNNIFAEVESVPGRVFHLDLKDEEGVDLRGNILSEDFRSELKQLNIATILCSNLLEHVEDPKGLCRAMLEILPSGGRLIITVPKNFWYHKDPIDTMFRPSVEELHALFPDTDLLKSEVVVGEGSFFADLKRNRKYLVKLIFRLLLPFYKYWEWRIVVADFINGDRPHSATCVLLKKM